MKTTRNLSRSFCVLIVVAIAAAVSAGCVGPKYDAGKEGIRIEVKLPIFNGSTGEPVSPSQLRKAFSSADVVFVGEEHDDAFGHAVQAILYHMALATHSETALSLEMLERNEQAFVDEYLAGDLPLNEFVEKTGSASWAQGGTWAEFYQPSIDIAKDYGCRVIAANTPRGYTKAARTEGYEALAALPAEERAYFDIPDKPLTGDYADRFYAFMEQMAARMVKEEGPTAEEIVESFFRGQMLWDRTMAGSIAAALDSGAKKVVHFVGQFHSDYEGGTVQFVKRLKPDAKVVVVSLQSGSAGEMREEDKDRADFIIYTGFVRRPK